MLAIEVERDAAGAQQLQAGRAGQPAGEERRAVEQMLAVVEDEQQPARAQGVAQGVGRRLAGGGRQRQGLHGGVGDVGRRLGLGQRDEGRAVGKLRPRGVAHRQRQARLADARRADQGQQPRRPQPGQKRGQLRLAAEQWQQWRGQGVLAAAGRVQHLLDEFDAGLLGTCDCDLHLARLPGQGQEPLG